MLQIGSYAFNWTNVSTMVECVVISEGITHIWNDAFMNAGALKEVYCPASLEYVGERAFGLNQTLQKVTFQGQMEHMDDYVFKDCPNLEEVVMPRKLEYIGEYVFSGCSSLTEISLPSGMRDIGKGIFSSCVSLKKISLPSDMKAIPYGFCYNCTALEKINFPRNLAWIDNYAFYECDSLVEVKLPPNILYVADWAFRDSGLKEVEIPASLMVIKGFEGCDKLERVTIENGPMIVAWGAFENCSNLRNISIPSSVTCMADGAFYGCTALTVSYNGEKYVHTSFEDLYKQANQRPEWFTFGIFYDDGAYLKIEPQKNGGYPATYYYYDTKYVGDLYVVEGQCLQGNVFSASNESLNLRIDEPYGRVPFYEWETSGCYVNVTVNDGYDHEAARVDRLPESLNNNNQQPVSSEENESEQPQEGEQNTEISEDDGMESVRLEFTTGSEIVKWGTKLFEGSSTEFNKELAQLSAVLCAAAENVEKDNKLISKDTYIEKAFLKLGFQEKDISLYSYPDSKFNVNDAQRDGQYMARDDDLAFSIASMPMEMNGEKIHLVVVVARGSKTIGEFTMDWLTDANCNFHGKKTYDIVYEFAADVQQGLFEYFGRHEELQEGRIKFLICGHSLGGATADLTAAWLTAYSSGSWAKKEDIYAYTYGAIDPLCESGNILEGFENIYNVFNFYDTFGPFGGRLILTAQGDGMINKYGHMYIFVKDFATEQGGGFLNAINHVISNYVEAMMDRDEQIKLMPYEDNQAFQELLNLYNSLQ